MEYGNNAPRGEEIIITSSRPSEIGTYVSITVFVRTKENIRAETIPLMPMGAF